MIRGTGNALSRAASAARTGWTAELGEAFLAGVREGGNAAAAARSAGAAAHVFYSRMRRDSGFRRRFREAAAAVRPATRARVRWSPELGERFLAIVRETGNARQAALRLGAPNAFCNMMRRDPAFRRRALEAAAEADARLARAESAFPAPPLEFKSGPPDDGGSSPPRRRPPPPPIAKVEPLPTDAEALGGYLRPARKRPQSRPQPVIRRNSKGRMQVTFAQEGHWTEEIEADFLAALRATGNFEACARAVGFDPSSVRERMKNWAAFERDCEEAFEEADVTLRYKLVAHANALMRSPGEAEAAGIEEEQVPFDPIMAMKILSHLEARKYGRSGKGRRKGPPERTFQQACESILRKIEAIERHEAMMKVRQEGGDGASSRDSGLPPEDGK